MNARAIHVKKHAWPFISLRFATLQRVIDGTYYCHKNNTFYADDGFGTLIPIPLNL
jgi:hypothetical protein